MVIDRLNLFHYRPRYVVIIIIQKAGKYMKKSVGCDENMLYFTV